MNNKNIILWVVGVLIIVGVGIMLSKNKVSNKEIVENTDNSKNLPITQNNPQPESPIYTTDTSSQQMVASAGSYESYSPEKITQARTKKVILFFKASWCPTCRAVDADIKANLSNIPKAVMILEVDYDNSQELKQKYGVTYQHTFVQVDENGSKLAKWSGSPTLSSLLREVK